MRNKNNVRKQAGNYLTWLEKRGGYDSSSLETLGDPASPYYVNPLSPGLDDMYEKLEHWYYTGILKGRQKQIIKLLLEGETNQTTIAKRLNMRQSNVSIELQKIREKLMKTII